VPLRPEPGADGSFQVSYGPLDNEHLSTTSAIVASAYNRESGIVDDSQPEQGMFSALHTSHRYTGETIPWTSDFDSSARFGGAYRGYQECAARRKPWIEQAKVSLVVVHYGQERLGPGRVEHRDRIAAKNRNCIEQS
jgi:hypothetical protein